MAQKRKLKMNGRHTIDFKGIIYFLLSFNKPG